MVDGSLEQEVSRKEVLVMVEKSVLKKKKKLNHIWLILKKLVIVSHSPKYPVHVYLVQLNSIMKGPG